MRELATGMTVFGIISSFFDYLTFGVLLSLGASPPIFRTGWFLESVISEVLVLTTLRTRYLFWRSRIGRPLFWLGAIVIFIAVVLTYSRFANAFGFIWLPGSFVSPLFMILTGYLIRTELAKIFLFKQKRLNRLRKVVGSYAGKHARAFQFKRLSLDAVRSTGA